MNASKYSAICLKVFGKVLPKQSKEKLEEKNIILEQANIGMDYREYSAMALMNVVIGAVGAIVAGVLLYLLFPTYYTYLLMAILPLVVAPCLAEVYLYLPTHFIKTRARNINLFLPYAINFISSMAVAGISPGDIFSTLAKIDVYGEVQTEAKKITKQIAVMGVDNITALKQAVETSPSRKFKVFIQGILGAIQSGSDLHTYLATIVDKYMEEDLISRKRDLDLLAVIAEVFIVSVIAFPIFLIIILTIMGFFGSSMALSQTILVIFSFLILPLVYACFYILIKSTSIEEVTRMQSKEKVTLKQYYKANKAPLFILFLSLGIIGVFYGILYLLNLYGYIALTFYQHVDFLFLSILFLLGPLGLYSYMEIKKKKEIHDRLPEFFIEIGDSLNTGMTIFDAIKVADKGHYGRLSPEIKKMKAQLSWNIAMKEVFNDFAQRMKSAIVKRLITTVNKGLVMGGKTPKIFKAAAKEVDQVNRLEHQRRTNMSVYTITIVMCFFIFLGIIVILNNTIFASFFGLQTEQVSYQGQAVAALSLSPVDPIPVHYSLFSFVFVQSIGAGVLAGFMADGKLSSGIRYSCVLGLVAFFIFKFLF